jgi:carbonyl reductase 1
MRAVLDLVLSEQVGPAIYGELVRFGQVLPWHDGAPSRYQGLLPTD